MRVGGGSGESAEEKMPFTKWEWAREGKQGRSGVPLLFHIYTYTHTLIPYILQMHTL